MQYPYICVKFIIFHVAIFIQNDLRFTVCTVPYLTWNMLANSLSNCVMMAARPPFCNPIYFIYTHEAWASLTYYNNQTSHTIAFTQSSVTALPPHLSRSLVAVMCLMMAGWSIIASASSHSAKHTYYVHSIHTQNGWNENESQPRVIQCTIAAGSHYPMIDGDAKIALCTHNVNYLSNGWVYISSFRQT